MEIKLKIREIKEKYETALDSLKIADAAHKDFPRGPLRNAAEVATRIATTLLEIHIEGLSAIDGEATFLFEKHEDGTYTHMGEYLEEDRSEA